jgi:dissimilatory sulfite reductase (desulfoviridin) alpha/beta subunit
MASSCCEISACRGVEGDCPFSLVDEPDMLGDIERVARESARVKAPADRDVCGPLHPKRLKIALSACPNACTQPQIKDVGVIAICVPAGIGASCDGCEQCEDVCREEAMAVRDSRATMQSERCVGCGACIGACPQKAIASDGVRFRILVGGAMGRHPRWGQELCVVDGSHVVDQIERFLDRIARRAEQGERFASVVERVGFSG